MNVTRLEQAGAAEATLNTGRSGRLTAHEEGMMCRARIED